MSFIIELLIFNQCSPGPKLERFQNEAFCSAGTLSEIRPSPLRIKSFKTICPIWKARQKLHSVPVLLLQRHLGFEEAAPVSLSALSPVSLPPPLSCPHPLQLSGLSGNGRQLLMQDPPCMSLPQLADFQFLDCS